MYVLSRTTGVYALCICVKICIDSICFVPHVYGHYVCAFRRYVYVMYLLSRTTGMGRLCVCAPQVSMHYLSALTNSISICHVCLCVTGMYMSCVSVCHRHVSTLCLCTTGMYLHSRTRYVCVICVCVSQVCIHCVFCVSVHHGYVDVKYTHSSEHVCACTCVQGGVKS